MDILSVLGLLIAIGIVFFVGASQKDLLLMLFDLPSFVFVFGGTLASTLIGTPKKHFLTAIKATLAMFAPKQIHSPEKLMPIIIELSKKSIRNGIFSLQTDAKKTGDPFFEKAIKLVVSGANQESIRRVLEKEVVEMRSRHREIANIFRTMGMFAPMFGLVGTILGIIGILHNMVDPSTIGQPLSLAIITTFYGVFLANIVFIPMSSKLRFMSAEETLCKEMIIEGLLCIQSGEMPYTIERFLQSFMAKHELKKSPGKTK